MTDWQIECALMAALLVVVLALTIWMRKYDEKEGGEA